MRINRILFLLSFFGGLLCLFIGIFLQFIGQSSIEYTYTKNYGVETTTFGGLQTILTGILLFLMSIWNYRNWKTEEKIRKNRIIEENTPPEKKVKNNRFFRRLQKKSFTKINL